MTFPFPWRRSVPGGCHSNSLLFKARTASVHPPYPHTQDGGMREGGLQRESTPAGSLLIGYISFSLLSCFSFNFFFTPSLHWRSLLYPTVLFTIHCRNSLLLSVAYFNYFSLFLFHKNSSPCRVSPQLQPRASGIYLHLTLSVHSSSTSLFPCLVQLSYTVPSSCGPVTMLLTLAHSVLVTGYLSCWWYNNLSLFW